MPKKTWTDSQIATLQEMQAAGRPHEEIATHIGVTRFAVTAKIRQLAKSGDITVQTRKPRSAWTVEMVAELKEFLARGMSFAAIAGEMGMTRSAISGKVDRLFSAPRPRNTIVSARRAKKAPAVPPSCNPISVMARTNGQCAYPVSDFSGPHEPFFCGAAIDEVEPIQSYCAWHRAIAMPPENQPRNRR